MNRSKLCLLPLVCLLTLVSCGEETFTEVTDSDAKSATLKAAQSEETSRANISGLKETVKTEVKNGSTTKSLTAKYEAIFDGDYMNSYTYMYVNKDNYCTMYYTYSSTDAKFTVVFDGKNTTSTGSNSVSFKYSSSSIGTVETTDDSKSEAILDSISVPSIAEITVSTDSFKIYTGSNGSTKITYASSESDVSGDYELIVGSDGYVSSTAFSGTSGDLTLSSSISYEYNVKKIDTLDTSKYTEVSGAQFAINTISIASIVSGISSYLLS